jgi:hypothetical protein
VHTEKSLSSVALLAVSQLCTTRSVSPWPSATTAVTLLAQEPWEILSFPAIAEADEEHRIETILEPKCFRRQGEALHPDREPLDTLDCIRRTIGEYNFAGHVAQLLGGLLVSLNLFGWSWRLIFLVNIPIASPLSS